MDGKCKGRLPIADCQLPIERPDSCVFSIGNWQSAIGNLRAAAVLTSKACPLHSGKLPGAGRGGSKAKGNRAKACNPSSCKTVVGGLCLGILIARWMGGTVAAGGGGRRRRRAGHVGGGEYAGRTIDAVRVVGNAQVSTSVILQLVRTRRATNSIRRRWWEITRAFTTG